MVRYCKSSCTSSHTWCLYATVRLLALPHIHDACTLLYVFLHFLTYMMLRYCTSSCTASHTWCYANVTLLALSHIHDATLLYVFLHFLTYMMLRYCKSSCTASHTWCYATVRLLALPHIHDATLLYVFLHFLTYMMLRYCTSSCTASHTWCYATVTLLALPHIHDATLLYVFLHFLTYMMLRYCKSSWTASHTWCYATVTLLALPHIHDATLLYVFLHFLTYMMLRYCKSSCTSSHTSLFQKTAKVLNETVQSRWLSLAIEKNARRNVLKAAYFKKTARKWRWFWKLMNAENIAKCKKKAKTQWHGESHELNCLPKPCFSHPMSSIWTPRTDKTVSHPPGCFNFREATRPSEDMTLRVKTRDIPIRVCVCVSVCLCVCVCGGEHPSYFCGETKEQMVREGHKSCNKENTFQVGTISDQPCFMKLTCEINICGQKGGLTQEIPWFNSSFSMGFPAIIPHHMACQWHHGCTLEAIGDVSEGQVHGRRAQAWKEMGLSWENRDHIVGYHPNYTNMMVTCMLIR